MFLINSEKPNSSGSAPSDLISTSDEECVLFPGGGGGVCVGGCLALKGLGDRQPFSKADMGWAFSGLRLWRQADFWVQTLLPALTSVFRLVPSASWVPPHLFPQVFLIWGFPTAFWCTCEETVGSPSSVSKPGSAAQVDASLFLDAKALCTWKGPWAAWGVSGDSLNCFCSLGFQGPRPGVKTPVVNSHFILSAHSVEPGRKAVRAEQRVDRCTLAAEWRPSRED